MSKSALSRLPAVEKVMHALGDVGLPRPIVLAAVREAVDTLRQTPEEIPEFDAFVTGMRDNLAAIGRTRLTPVINGTGVLIHTNLGRSPLPEHAAARLASIATCYNNLELDLNTGERGKRAGYLERCLALVSGAEAATSVNNCASALVIILRHFVREGRHKVIISRSQLVEIGGGFRIPDILLASGATLHEIGTTNKTTLADYENAIDDETALILKVHQSNFYMGGFIENVETEELAELAKLKGVPFCEDLGSGAVVNTDDFGPVEHEPTPAEIIAQGVDLICFSGDKLLGGPQAGIIAGRAELVAGIKKEPFYRALRCDKLILSMLEAVTSAYLEGRTDVPLLEMLSTPIESLQQRGAEIVAHLDGLPLSVSLGSGESRIGGGTMPKSAIPSVTLELKPENMSVTKFAKRLRFGKVPVMGYTAEGTYKIDLRTVFPRQDTDLTEAIRAAMSS
jgi:L-seryl-tRNA(Ser) seleniumtransferase